MDLFHFDPVQVFSFLLTLFRISLVLFLLPFFGGQVLPTPAKVSLTIVLALALWPALSFPGVAFPANIWSIMLMLLGELTLGLVLGLLVQFLFAAVQMGGSIMGFQMGFAMVNIVDPLTGVSEPVTSHFMYMVTLLTFLTLGGHLVLLSGLAKTFELVPPGGLYLTPRLGDQMVLFAGQIFVLAIRIAAPVMAAVILVDLSLALISRVAPQMNVLMLGFPVKIAVGFLFMGFIFTYLSRFVGQYIDRLGPAFRIILHMATP